METIGRYQILGELGRGAMGIVYRALDPAINRPVAIKTIRLAEFTDEAERERLRDRLFREAQSAGILSHPNIVTVYDVGEQDDVTYIAMEFVNGPSLEKVLLNPEPPEPQKVISILQQTAAALDFAHKKGIVHRDIKPANIMLDEEGVAKITDFGVAKITQSQQMTQTGTVLGTPNYMSPEQVQGKAVDGRADQFSLAVAAYEMLTGEKPFAAEQLTTVLYKIVSEEPLPPHHLNPSLGWAVAMVLSRAMSKDPAKRYPTCTEFINALEAALKTKKGWKPIPRGASQNLPTEVVGAPIGVATAQHTVRVGAQRSRLVWQIFAAGLAALGVVGLIFVGANRWFSQSYPEQQAATQPPPPITAPQTESKPPPMPPVPATAPALDSAPPAEPAATAETPAAAAEAPVVEEPKPKPAAAPAATQSQREAAPPEEQPLQIVTSPPGADVILDNNLSKTCKTPCTFNVVPGRHTLAITMNGYRRELRIAEVAQRPQELFVNLIREMGVVVINTDIPGAQILIDGKPIQEKTPAKLSLPAGRYMVTVVKDGRRADQEIQVKDGSLLNFSLQLNP
ncbi:MAG: protein kinase domain-containing protein [Rhodospirillales bacterium]